jgi:hypothetical protein
MRTRKKRRIERACAPIERMEDRCLLSAALPNGTANAMAYDTAGKLWVAYYDTASHNLKYALRNADGTWAQLADNVIDAGTAPTGYSPDVGQMVTMTIERGGLPGVAYYDATNADLKYAHYNGSTWDVAIVESYRTTGYYPSIAYNPGTNRPAIAYHYATNGDLRLRQFNGTNWGCDADYQWVDGQADNVGRFCVLALDRTGRWAIGYDDSTNGAAKYAFQGTGGVWSVRMVDNVPQQDVAFTSLAFDSGNRPALAYYDTYLADLKFAKGSDASATTFNAEVLAAKNTAGKYTNLTYDTATNKFTVYYNLEAGGVTKINYLTGNTGAWGAAQTLYAGGGSEARILQMPGAGNGITYSWSAPDANGNNTLYVNDTTSGTTWRQDTTDAGMLGRVKYAGYAVHTVNGVEKIFSIAGDVDDGGLGATGYYTLSNLVRASSDGGVTWQTWAPQNSAGGAAFAARSDAVTVSFQGKLWVIGGGAPNYVADVWSSPDGVTWTRENDLPAGIGPRANMAAAVSGDGSTLYLIGGTSSSPTGTPGDVWQTTDGSTWTQQTASAPFGSRYKTAALWFNNRLWVLGGTKNVLLGVTQNQDDAWWSSDGGTTSHEATDVAGATRFTPRAGHTAAVYDNRMWVLGGQYSDLFSIGDLDDAWYSFDGINWTQAATGNEAFRRNGAGTVVFGGRLVTMFGENMSMKNDVWSTT